jgi:pimeloyl-ACP methyl ester carboxylesterase
MMTGMSLPRFQIGSIAASHDARMPYVSIGEGPRTMVVVPGAADGLRTCVDIAIYLAWFYRERARNSRVVVFSRREPLPAGFGMERHADDLIRAADELDAGPAVWECLSAAGPIGQWVAVKRPDLVRGLVLASSYDYVSSPTRRALAQWRDIASNPQGLEAFSESLAHKFRPPPEVLATLEPSLLPPAARPPDTERLMRILDELVDLDQRSLSRQIICPTLVIGGALDRVAPAAVQREMAERIPTSRLELCPGYGHFNDMENPAYPQHIAEFAAEVERGPAR